MIYETNYLIHYNHNHDKLGRFAKSSGIKAFKSINSLHDKKIDTIVNKYSDKSEYKKYKEELSKATSETGKILVEMDEMVMTDKLPVHQRCVAEMANMITPNSTVEDMSWTCFFGGFEDGGQSPINENSLSAFENNVSLKKVKNVLTKYNENVKERETLHKRIVDNVLDRIGYVPVDSNKNYAVSSLYNNHEYDKKLFDYGVADDLKNYDLVLKSSNQIKMAKDFAKKLQINEDDPYTSWWNFSMNLYDAPVGKKQIKDLTDADWKQINELIKS